MSDHVFGYGSLVADLGGRPATVRGAVRGWTVAMDNGLDLPGYKYHLDTDGNRPDVCVAFLDLELVDDTDATVDGICHPVTDADLAVLDRRERQYHRVDVTARVDPNAGRTWTYVGRPGSRDRAAVARAAGRLRIARSYLALVPPVAVPPDVPVVDLLRVDLP